MGQKQCPDDKPLIGIGLIFSESVKYMDSILYRKLFFKPNVLNSRCVRYTSPEKL